MTGEVRVLLVDENPMILELLRSAVSQFATVQTASDGTDALLKAIEEPPDLIISDYQMPGVDGRQLLEKVKGRPQTARTPVILLASRADISDRLKPVQDQVEDFIEKPFFIKEAARRVKRVVDKIALEKMAKAAPADGRLRGTLAQMSAMDLLQSLDLSRKSCSLVVSNAGERAQMYFSEGQVTHAECGQLAGDEAVYKVLTWSDGAWEIDFHGASSQQTTTRSTQGLLMEGLRLLDEANRDSDESAAAEPEPPPEGKPPKPSKPAPDEDDVLEM